MILQLHIVWVAIMFFPYANVGTESSGSAWLAAASTSLIGPRKTFCRLTHNLHNPTSPGSDTITALYEDSHSGVWVGHFLGVDWFDPVRKVCVPVLRWPKETLGLVGSVTSFLEDTRGNLWMGTVERGLIRINRSNGDTTRYLHEPGKGGRLPCNTVRKVYQRSVGRLWIGTTKGIARFDYETGHFENYDLGLPRRHRYLDPRTPPSSDALEVVGILAGQSGGALARTFGRRSSPVRYSTAPTKAIRRERRRGSPRRTEERILHDSRGGHLLRGDRRTYLVPP